MNAAESLSVALCALPGVEQTRSRFDKTGRPAWRVDGREFAHFHADDLIDLRLPAVQQRSLRDDPRAHFRASKSDWLEFEFHTGQDVQDAAALARQAWAAACKPHSSTA